MSCNKVVFAGCQFGTFLPVYCSPCKVSIKAALDDSKFVFLKSIGRIDNGKGVLIMGNLNSNWSK